MRCLALCLVLVVSSSTNLRAAAQENSGDSGPPVAEQAIRTPMSLVAMAAQIERLQEQVDELQGQQRTAHATKIELESEISALKIRVEDLGKSMEEVVAKDPATQQRISNVLGNMQKSDTFRENLRSATQGRLVLHNFTGEPRLLYINGNAWQVRTNESYIWVPLGVVSIQRSVSDAPTLVTHWEFKKNLDPRTSEEIPYYSEATYNLNVE